MFHYKFNCSQIWNILIRSNSGVLIDFIYLTGFDPETLQCLNYAVDFDWETLCSTLYQTNLP